MIGIIDIYSKAGRAIWAAFLALLIVCVSASALFAENQQNGNDLIITTTKVEEQYQVNAEFIVNTAPEAVWKVLHDYEHHAEFIPQCLESEVVKKEGNRIWVRILIKILFMKMPMTTVHDVDEKNLFFTWDLVDGPFIVNSGSWKLEKIGPKKTRVFYKIRVVHRFLHDWMAAAIAKQTLPEYVDAMRNRAIYEMARNGE